MNGFNPDSDVDLDRKNIASNLDWDHSVSFLRNNITSGESCWVKYGSCPYESHGQENILSGSTYICAETSPPPPPEDLPLISLILGLIWPGNYST